MKLKKIRKRVWCHEAPVHIPGLGASGILSGNTIRTKSKIKPERKIPVRIKCPDCKKRFKPRIRDCGDGNCWHVFLPAHKKLV